MDMDKDRDRDKKQLLTEEQHHTANKNIIFKTGKESSQKDKSDKEKSWEAAARAIAEKVQRQQDGVESAMIGEEHKDDDFQPMDDMKTLLEEQIDTLFKTKNKATSSYGNRGYLNFNSITSMVASSVTSSSSDKSPSKSKLSRTVSKEVTERIGKWYTERAKYIPLRLTLKERKYLRLVENVFRVSQYTDLVDGHQFSSAQKRLHRQIQCVSSILGSLTIALDYDIGAKVIVDKSFGEYSEQYAKILELCRRYKIMNPEKLRGTYGKLIYFLQDSSLEEVSEALEIDLLSKIATVYSVLEEAGAEDVLKSEWISTATREITSDGKTRSQVQKEIKHKEVALKAIANKYESDNISAEMVKQCVLSLGDNSNYLLHNCDPIEYVIDLLKEYFSPEVLSSSKRKETGQVLEQSVREGEGATGAEGESKWSLAIYGEKDGSRLTHSHERQYFYVLQSLTLWKEILHDMFRLWYLAEQDLLDRNIQETSEADEAGEKQQKKPKGCDYRLVNTGQGIHRLQSSPRVLKAMHGILYAVQQKLGRSTQGWVGSSVIHLGDTNVPNAFMFIDKYNQVPRILNPIVQCLKNIDNFVVKDEGLKKYVEEAYGSVEDCKKTILRSFFREGFDGSGGDNFFEAGSCIDGRLTSAWNWCQKLPSKNFFYLFKLKYPAARCFPTLSMTCVALFSGFLGFDGNFQS